MKTFCEFRILGKFAPLLFRDDEGERLGRDGWIRKVILSTDDPKYYKIPEVEKTIRKKHKTSFFAGWNFIRKYSKKEIQDAALFRMIITGYTDDSPSDHGTLYSISRGCNICSKAKFGAKQLNEIFAFKGKLPKKDFIRMHSGEVMLSSKAAMSLKKYKISGYNLKNVRLAKGSKTFSTIYKEVLNEGGEMERRSFGDPIQLSKSNTKKSDDFFQLVLNNTKAKIVAPTQVGIRPFDFDEDHKYRCKCGRILSWTLLSEVTIRAITRVNFDIFASYNGFGGGCMGYQNRVILVSQRFREAVLEEKLTGCKFEVAYFNRPRVKKSSQ